MHSAVRSPTFTSALLSILSFVVFSLTTPLPRATAFTSHSSPALFGPSARRVATVAGIEADLSRRPPRGLTTSAWCCYWLDGREIADSAAIPDGADVTTSYHRYSGVIYRVEAWSKGRVRATLTSSPSPVPAPGPEPQAPPKRAMQND